MLIKTGSICGTFSIACLKFSFMILLAISWDTTLFKALGCSVWILFLKGVVLRKLIEGDALLYLNRNQIFN